MNNHSSMNGKHTKDASCCAPKNKKDVLLITTGILIAFGYSIHLFPITNAPDALALFANSIFGLINAMWWGLLFGIFFVGVLDRIPKQIIISILGKGGTFSGIVRACAAGVLLDLCSHGILLVGMKLYRQGASLGQVMAFLISSPWNSLSLTLILWSLIGLPWTLVFIFLSILIAFVSGLIIDLCVHKGILEKNPHTLVAQEDFSFRTVVHQELRKISLKPTSLFATFRDGLQGSTMILRWIFFGTVLAALLQTFVSADQFQTFFGPTLAGLGMTLIIATIIEVCSEGSVPVAADLLTRAAAPGNAFAFLMTGVSTDYTEILSLKETTGSWKTSFFLPLVTVPQVIAIAMIINHFSLT